MKNFKFLLCVFLAAALCLCSCGKGASESFAYSWKNTSVPESPIKMLVPIPGTVSADNVELLLSFGQLHEEGTYDSATLNISAPGFDVYIGGEKLGTGYCEIEYNALDSFEYTATKTITDVPSEKYLLAHTESITLKLVNKSKASGKISFILSAGQEVVEGEDFNPTAATVKLEYEIKGSKISFIK